MRAPLIRFDSRAVALMVRITIMTVAQKEQCAKESGVDQSTLESIAAGRQRPNAATLAWLQLERCGKEYVWEAL